MRVELFNYCRNFCLQYKNNIRFTANLFLFFSGGCVLAAGGFGTYFISPCFLTATGTGIGAILGSILSMVTSKRKTMKAESDSPSSSSCEKNETEETQPPIYSLPMEILAHIFEFLGPCDLYQVSQVDKVFYELAHTPDGQLEMLIKDRKEWDNRICGTIKEVFPSINDIPVATITCDVDQIKDYWRNNQEELHKGYQSPVIKGKMERPTGLPVYFISIILQCTATNEWYGTKATVSDFIVFYSTACDPLDWCGKTSLELFMDFNIYDNSKGQKYLAIWLKKILNHQSVGALPMNYMDFPAYKEGSKEWNEYSLWPFETTRNL